jgi:hypothetical protein
MTQGMRDAIGGHDTPHAEAFYEMAALTMSAMYRRAVKGNG